MIRKKDYWILIIITILVVVLNHVLVWAESTVEGGAINSFGEAFWYMIVTLTTVGYGDLYPISFVGRIIGYLYVFSSIGLLGILLSSVMNRYNTIKEAKKLGFMGTDYQNHVILFGWNSMSRQVLDSLLSTDIYIVVVTDHKDNVDLIYDEYGRKKIFVLFSDLKNSELYDKINAKKSKMIFISIKDESESIMHVINFKKHCPNNDIIITTTKSRLKGTFEAAGARHVISQSEIISKLVASYIFEPDVAELNLDLLDSSEFEHEYDVMEFKVTKDNIYLNSNCKELFHNIKKDFDAVLLAIRKLDNNKRVLMKNPGKGVIVEAGDYLIVMGNHPIRINMEQSFDVKEGVFD